MKTFSSKPLLYLSALFIIISGIVFINNSVNYFFPVGQLQDFTQNQKAQVADIIPDSNGFINASQFGFDPNSADNFGAMRNLEKYANEKGKIKIKFNPGRYTVIFPVFDGTYTLYRGYYTAACDLKNISDSIIDASEAEFYTPDLRGAGGTAFFHMWNSNNVQIKASFRGEHDIVLHDEKTGASGVKVFASTNIDLDIKAIKML